MNDLLSPQNYDMVQNVEVVFDGNDNPVAQEDLKLTPLQVIKTMAQVMGQDLSDPKPNCKMCYGRGYTGRDSKSQAPIPCTCMYSKEAIVSNNLVQSRMHHKNRSERRQYEKYMAKQMKITSTIIPQVEGVDVDNL